MALICYAGEVGAGERALAPFRTLAEPVADMVRPMRYPEIYTLFGDEAEGPGPAQEVARSLFVDAVDSNTGKPILDHLQASTAPMAVAQLRVLGGAMARVAAENTAFAHRGRRVMVAIGAVYERAEESPVHEAWVADSRPRSSLTPASTSTSLATRARSGCGAPTRGRPGTGWWR
jgi:hypothetical protein